METVLDPNLLDSMLNILCLILTYLGFLLIVLISPSILRISRNTDFLSTKTFTYPLYASATYNLTCPMNVMKTHLVDICVFCVKRRNS